MKTLKIKKGDESYTLTFKDDDPPVRARPARSVAGGLGRRGGGRMMQITQTGLYTTTLTGALVERNPGKALRQMVRELRRSSGRYVEAMDASPTPIPGGWSLMVFVGDEEDA